MSRSITLQPICNEQMCTGNERCHTQRARLSRLPWTRGDRRPRCHFKNSGPCTSHTSERKSKTSCIHCILTVPYIKRYVWHATDRSSDLRPAWRRFNMPHLALFKTLTAQNSFKQNSTCTRFCDTGLKLCMSHIRTLCSTSLFHRYLINEDLT